MSNGIQNKKGQFGLDGSYELAVPYRDSRELEMDILKYGPDVEVLMPTSLRNQIQQKLQRAVTNYASKDYAPKEQP